MFGVVLPSADPKDVIEGSLARLNALQELFASCIVISPEYLDGKQAERTWDITSQRVPKRCQCETVLRCERYAECHQFFESVEPRVGHSGG